MGVAAAAETVYRARATNATALARARAHTAGPAPPHPRVRACVCRSGSGRVRPARYHVGWKDLRDALTAAGHKVLHVEVREW